MAITLGNLTTRFSTANPTQTENVSVPAGAVANVDWYVLMASAAPTFVWDLPSGFTQIAIGNAANGRSVIVWYRRATGTEGATFTASHNAPTGTSLAVGCQIVKPTDSSFSLAVDVTDLSDSAGASTSPISFASITTTVANTLIFRIAGVNLSSGSTNALATPTGHTEAFDAHTTAATGVRTHLVLNTIAQAAAGASGSPTAALTTARPWQTVNFAIRESPVSAYHPFLDRRRRAGVAVLPFR